MPETPVVRRSKILPTTSVARATFFLNGHCYFFVRLSAHFVMCSAQTSGKQCAIYKEMEKYPEFGPVLRRLRFEKGLSQEELAERVGMASHAHLSRLESRRAQPSVEMLFRLADALDVPASAIISEMEKDRQDV